jgi:transposase InsO family protein
MTAAEIAELLTMPLSTVSLILKRGGLGKRSSLTPLEPPNRYERERPGELVHVDVKKLGRIVRPGHRVFGRTSNPGWKRRRYYTGWEYLHVCVDDYTRLAYAEVLDDERGPTAAGFLERAVAWYHRHGVIVERVMTDNGSAYRSTVHAAVCRQLGIRHLTTRPYRPRTNGKAERFIQTILNDWAYARLYGSSRERTDLLPTWLDHYNWRRPHGSLNHKPPGTRLRDLNKVLGNYT